MNMLVQLVYCHMCMQCICPHNTWHVGLSFVNISGIWLILAVFISKRMFVYIVIIWHSWLYVANYCYKNVTGIIAWSYRSVLKNVFVSISWDTHWIELCCVKCFSLPVPLNYLEFHIFVSYIPDILYLVQTEWNRFILEKLIVHICLLFFHIIFFHVPVLTR